MADYRSRRDARSRWDRDRGDETNRGSFGYEGEGFMHGGGRDMDDRWNDYERDRGWSGRDFSGGTYGATYGSELERSRPSYRGRGPKNYRRSDERIREDVCERLTDDSRVDASDLEIQVQDGVVTMSGSISDRDMKRRAEDIAESVNGVRDVQNQIRVERARGEERPETRS